MIRRCRYVESARKFSVQIRCSPDKFGPINQIAESIIFNAGTTSKKQPEIQKEKTKEVLLPYMWPRTSLLLDLYVRFSDMPGVHDGEFVGHDL